jgi:hypothetical protein
MNVLHLTRLSTIILFFGMNALVSWESWGGELVSSTAAHDGDFLTLRVRLGGEMQLFALDTGSQRTIFDKQLRIPLSAATHVERKRAFATDNEEDLFSPPKMSVVGTKFGSVEFPEGSAVKRMDLSWIRRSTKLPINGILGMDFLEQYAVKLNFAEGTVALLDSRKLDRKELGVDVPIEIHDRRPFVELKTGSAEYWAMIDTGGLLTMRLQPEVYEHLLSADEITPEVFTVFLNKKKLLKPSDYSGRIKTVKLGSFVHRDLVCFWEERGEAGLLGRFISNVTNSTNILIQAIMQASISRLRWTMSSPSSSMSRETVSERPVEYKQAIKCSQLAAPT